VIVGARANSSSGGTAREDGFRVESIEEATVDAEAVSVLLPDQHHAAVYREAIEPVLDPGKLLLFGHGFSVHFGLIEARSGIDVALVAPIGPGKILRQLYLEGFGIPALFAVHQNATGRAEDLALAYAAALGCTRVGVLPTTFAEETETDLFGEQAILCGGMTALLRAGFDTLVEAGYRPELAYFECVHQVKLIADLIYESGVACMNEAISDTAEFGEYMAGPRIVDERAKDAMRGVLKDIQDGTFARRWMADVEAGNRTLLERRAGKRDHPMEEVGLRLRAMMRHEDGAD